MKRKRLLSAVAVLAAVCLCFAALPKTAHAASYLTIGGAGLTQTTCYYTNGPGGRTGTTTSTEPSDWSAHLSGNTLTLRGLYVDLVNEPHAINVTGDLTIVLIGANSAQATVSGLRVNNGRVTVSGTGTLTVSAAGGDGHVSGVFLDNFPGKGSLTLSSGTLIADGASYGIFARDDDAIAVNGGTLIAKGQTQQSLNQAPSLGYPGGSYRWKAGESAVEPAGDYFVAPGDPFTWTAAYRYVELRGNGAVPVEETVAASVPKTGDRSMPLLFAGLAALAGTGLIVLRRKRRGL